MDRNIKVKDVEVVNVSGEPIDIEQWSKGDKLLAIKTANWLAQKLHNNTCISTTNDGAILIDYVLGGEIQPTVKIYAGKIIWPRGTNFDLMMAFLGGASG